MTEAACRSEITASGEPIRNPNPNIYLLGSVSNKSSSTEDGLSVFIYRVFTVRGKTEKAAW